MRYRCSTDSRCVISLMIVVSFVSVVKVSKEREVSGPIYSRLSSRVPFKNKLSQRGCVAKMPGTRTHLWISRYSFGTGTYWHTAVAPWNFRNAVICITQLKCLVSKWHSSLKLLCIDFLVFLGPSYPPISETPRWRWWSTISLMPTPSTRWCLWRNLAFFYFTEDGEDGKLLVLPVTIFKYLVLVNGWIFVLCLMCMLDRWRVQDLRNGEKFWSWLGYQNLS